MTRPPVIRTHRRRNAASTRLWLTLNRHAAVVAADATIRGQTLAPARMDGLSPALHEDVSFHSPTSETPEYKLTLYWSSLLLDAIHDIS